MSEATVVASAFYALNGLYVTPDLCWMASYTMPDYFDAFVSTMHRSQPLSASYEHFSNFINETHIRLHVTQQRFPTLASVLPTFDKLMVMADLVFTRPIIGRGLTAAIDMALAVHLHAINAPDQATYPRIIAPGLETFQLTDRDQINTEATFMRILTSEPWISWLERLRAQRQRTAKTFARGDLAKMILQFKPGEVARNSLKVGRGERRELHTARRSIRRSVEMFTKLGLQDDLKTFLGTAVPTAQSAMKINGARYDYQITMKSQSLINYTVTTDSQTTPVHTVVFNKAGDRLCEVCIYFEDTPLLDHVLAMRLNAQDADTELELLNAMCVMEAPKAFYDDPLLPDLKGLHDPVLAPIFIDNVFHYVESLNDLDLQQFHTELRRDAQATALQTFKRIMAWDEPYLNFLSASSQFEVWDFLVGHPDTLTLLQEPIT